MWRRSTSASRLLTTCAPPCPPLLGRPSLAAAPCPSSLAGQRGAPLPPPLTPLLDGRCLWRQSIWAQLKHGSHLALEMVVGGQRYSGEDIERKGIALMAVDDTEVLAAARGYAAELAKNDGPAMHVVKEMLRRVRGGKDEDFSAIVAACNSANEVRDQPGGGFPSLEASKNIRGEAAPKL